MIEIRNAWAEKDTCCRCHRLAFVHSGSDGHRYCHPCATALVEAGLAAFGGNHKTERHHCRGIARELRPAAAKLA